MMKKLILLIICGLLFQGCFTTKKQYSFDDGKYLIVWKDGQTGEPVRGFEFSITKKKGIIEFIDPRYGVFSFEGEIFRNNFEAYYKFFSEEVGEKGVSVQSSALSRLLKWITFGTLIQTPYIECTFGGELVGHNKITGNYASSDSKGNAVNGEFDIIPSKKLDRKVKYSNLSVGNGVGPKITKIDPRRVIIQLEENGIIKVDDKIVDKSKLKEILSSQARKFGNNIPILLYVDKKVKFSNIKKLFGIIEDSQVYKCRFDYFWDKDWDGLTCYPFELPIPEGKPPAKPPAKNILTIACQENGNYRITDEDKSRFLMENNTFNAADLKSRIKRVGDNENIKLIFLDVEDSCLFEDLIRILELTGFYNVKVKFAQARCTL